MESDKFTPEIQKKINYLRRMNEDVPFIGGEPEKRLTDDEWYYIIQSMDGTEKVFAPEDDDDTD